jgi:hypothetical protein
MIIYKRGFLILLTILFGFKASAFSWTEPQQLTNRKGDSLLPQVAVYKSNVYMVWEDATAGSNRDIYFKKSINAGQTWTEDKRIGWSGDALSPKIALFGNNIYVFWEQGRTSQRKIYFIKSLDKGRTWSKPVMLGECGWWYLTSINFGIFINEKSIHLVWKYGNDSSDDGIYYRRSTDAGVTWERIKKLAGRIVWYGSPINPTIVAYKNSIHVVWQDTGEPYGTRSEELLYIRSLDNGKNWTKPKLIKSYPSANITFYPTLMINGSKIHLVWVEPGPGNSYRVLYKGSLNGGTSWTKNKVIYSTTREINICSAVLDLNTIHIVWDHETNNPDIYYGISDDNGKSWYPKEYIVKASSTNPQFPSIGAYKGKVHVFWQERLSD